MSYGNEKLLNENLPVIKKNILIEGKFKVTSLEYKLMMTALSKTSVSDDVLKPIEFSVNEFYGLTGEKAEGGLYPYLKRVCERLMSRVITINTDNGWTMFNWFHRIKYEKGKGRVIIQFHEDLAPFLLYMKGNKEYTKYLLENIVHLDSIYAIRIYELLKQFKNIGKRTIDIIVLKEMLGIEKTKHKKYSDFKKYVLLQAEKEINIKTDLRFKYQEEYDGRKITAITFFIAEKEKSIVSNDNKFNSLDALPKKQLILLIQKEIQNRHVTVIELYQLDNFHRFILLNLYKKIIKGDYQKTNIRNSIAFYKDQLNKMADIFDTTSIKDF